MITRRKEKETHNRLEMYTVFKLAVNSPWWQSKYSHSIFTMHAHIDSSCHHGHKIMHLPLKPTSSSLIWWNVATCMGLQPPPWISTPWNPRKPEICWMRLSRRILWQALHQVNCCKLYLVNKAYLSFLGFYGNKKMFLPQIEGVLIDKPTHRKMFHRFCSIHG